MTSIRSKNIYGINPAHHHPHQKKGGTSALSQHPVSPIHIITTQHTNMLCLKRIEQSTLLSSQTTHHTNNTTTHKHACRDHHQPVRDIATPFWVTTYTTILASRKKHKLKLCVLYHTILRFIQAIILLKSSHKCDTRTSNHALYSWFCRIISGFLPPFAAATHTTIQRLSVLCKPR